MNISSLLRHLVTASLLLTGLALAPAQAQPANAFITLEQVMPSDTAGKVEVLEFFSYSCPHCRVMEPLIERWQKSLPERVTLIRVPVAFNASMADLQRMYYTLEALGRTDLHSAFFAALHDERQRLFTQDAMTAWAADKGIDRDTFSNTFRSFGVTTKVSRADALARSYQVEGTPSIAVGGRYLTSPSLANGYEETLRVANQLIERLP